MKKLSVISLSLAALLALSSCSGSEQKTSAASAQAAASTQSSTEESSLSYPVTITVGYSTAEDDPRGIAIAKMKETIEKETGGNVLLEIHPSGELGSDADLIQGEIDKKVGMTVSSAGNYAAYALRIGVSALPFLFTDFESAWAFVDSDTMTEINAELEPFNIHVLSYFDNGFRCVTTSENVGAVNSVEDMNGLKIRTPENQIVMETMSALGASPQSYPFAQLKDALKDGTFDAQENPIPVIYNNKLYEVQKYLAITNHSYDAMPLTIRSDIWNELTPEYREIIEKAADEASAENRALVKQQTEDFVSKLEEAGMTVTYPELGQFKDATSGVIDFFASVYGQELIDKIRA